MELKIGESKTFTLPFWLKAVDMNFEKNGLRLERKKGNAILYVNNGSRFNTYAGVPLGPVKTLNQVGFTVKAHSASRILFNVGAVRFVIDYNAKKLATNLVGLRVGGSKEWGDRVQMPWRGEFQTLFGLPMPPMEMDKDTAKLFWQWFHVNEADIVKMVTGDKKQNKSIFQQINLWLCPVFPYAKNNEIDFDLKCGEGDYSFIFRPRGNDQLQADAQAFCNEMPDNMAKRWKFVLEE